MKLSGSPKIWPPISILKVSFISSPSTFPLYLNVIFGWPILGSGVDVKEIILSVISPFSNCTHSSGLEVASQLVPVRESPSVLKLKIKSLGLLLLAVIPGAFVEPDEKELKKKNWKSQLRIYAAGSYANILMAAVFWLILTFVISPLFFMPAVGFLGYVNPSEYNYSGVFPAQEVNLTGSILKINEQRTEEWNDLVRIMNEKKPGDVIEITTTKGTYSLQLVENPERPGKAYIGIGTNENLESVLVLKDNYRETSTGDVVQWFTQLFAWIMLLNVGIGIVNLLPIKPLDGGLMMEALTNRFVPKQSDFIVSFFAGMSLMLILWTFLGGFI